MKKLTVAVVLVVFSLLVFGCMPSQAVNQPGGLNTEQAVESDSDSSVVWKEVELTSGLQLSSLRPPFNLESHLEESDFIFKGKIVSHVSYELSWTDRDGNDFEGKAATVMTVQVLEAYLGSPSVESNQLKLYFSRHFTDYASGTFVLEDGREYVFFVSAFGERFLEESLIGTPYYKDEIEKYADMYIAGNARHTLPIENGRVAANIEYDFEGKAVSLDEPGKARELAPLSFERFQRGDPPIVEYSSYSEDYFVAALKHFWKEFNLG